MPVKELLRKLVEVRAEQNLLDAANELQERRQHVVRYKRYQMLCRLLKQLEKQPWLCAKEAKESRVLLRELNGSYLFHSLEHNAARIKKLEERYPHLQSKALDAV